jgi:hypothetical protein
MRVPGAKSSGGSQEHPNLPRAWESSSGGESWLHDGLRQQAIPVNGRSETVIYSLLATEELRLTELEGFYRPTCRWVNRNEAASCPVGGGSGQSISGLDRDEPLRWSAGGKAPFVTRQEEAQVTIAHLDLQTGRRAVLKTVSPTGRGA